jgi:hypothetical protein
MTLDNEQQKNLILELLNSNTFQGSYVEVVYELKKAVENATIQDISS